MIFPARDSVERVMTDNAPSYRRSHDFAAALGALEAGHRLIRPYRPQTNGKVERLNRTLVDEWAYVRPYDSNLQRQRALETWLHIYNHHRPHTSLKGRAPMEQLDQHVSGKHS